MGLRSIRRTAIIAVLGVTILSAMEITLGIELLDRMAEILDMRRYLLCI